MKKENIDLIFVYNADSGWFDKVKDYFHKIIRPSTYACNLCALTFDNFGMKKDWKEYVKNLNIPIEFLHKDEFEKEYSSIKVKYPVAFFKKNSNLKIFISSDEFNGLKTLEELENLVLDKIKNLK